MTPDRGRSRRLDFLVLGGLALALVALAWVAGFASSVLLDRGGPPVPQGVDAPDNFGLYAEAWSHVDREFYGETPDPHDVARGAVTGLIEAIGDPHAAFLSAGADSDEAPNFRPQYLSSLGLWAEPVLGGLAVLSVEPDSNAAEAGLRSGDTVLAVDQTALGALDRAGMLEILDGEDGEQSMLIIRDNDGQAQSVEISRSFHEQPTATVDEPRDGVAYLRVPDLGSSTLADLDEILAVLGGSDHDALIVDLRDNPGGDLATLPLFVGRFSEGTAWIDVGADGNETAYAADDSGAPRYDAPPTVRVLVNDGTVGTAEMLAASLRDNLGAELVGSRTYGRESHQDLIELADGSLVRLTVGRWRTPAGADVGADGLTPDHEVEGSDEQLDAALRAFGGKPESPGG